MTDDEREASIREAHIIISRWIHRKTGVSEFERGMRGIGEVFRSFTEAVKKAIYPTPTTTDKQDEECEAVK